MQFVEIHKIVIGIEIFNVRVKYFECPYILFFVSNITLLRML